MGIFTKPEHKFASAVADVEKFVGKFEAAAKQAQEELVQQEAELTKAVDKKDSTIEKAYSKYVQVEKTEQERYSTFEAVAKERSVLLKALIEKSNTVATNFRTSFGL